MHRSLIALALPLALSGCKKTFDLDAAASVCASGEGVSDAAAYDPAAARSANLPVAMYEHFADLDKWVANEPTEFHEAGVELPTAETIGTAQLAFCVDARPGPFDRDCGMDNMSGTLTVGGDSPKADVHATGGKSVVKAYASKYTLTARELKTGRVVSTTTLDVPVRHCPLLTLGDKHEDYVDISDQALLDAFRPLLPASVAARVHPTPDF